jgi:Rrf2 family nitric oxide-sensitive transcriptional repressor
MQLNRFTDYGLRVLMYLHAPEADELVTIQSIAERYGIPQNHLNKVVQRLVKLGWVDTRPGRNGGVRLAERGTPLLLGDVLRELEGHPSLIECANPPCPLLGGCHLKRVLEDGRAAFYADMNRHSLADLVSPPTAGLLMALHRSDPKRPEIPKRRISARGAAA